MRKKEEEGNARAMRLLTGVLLGGTAALICSLVLLALLSLLVSQGTIGEKNLYQLALAACVLSSFIGGRIAVKRAGICALPTGVGSGAVFVGLMLVAGFLCMRGLELGGKLLALLLCGLAGGAVAGLLGGKRKKKRRK